MIGDIYTFFKATLRNFTQTAFHGKSKSRWFCWSQAKPWFDPDVCLETILKITGIIYSKFRHLKYWEKK